MKLSVIGNERGVKLLNDIMPMKRACLADLPFLSSDTLVFSISAPIIPKNVIDSCKCTLVNLHTAPLPHYRGCATDSWMILNGDDGKWHYGCAHYLIEKIDAGNIIAVQPFYVPEHAYPVHVWKARVATLPSLVRQTITLLQMGFKGIPQDETKAHYFRRLNTDIDGEINWRQPAYMVERKVRAFRDPYLGAWMEWEGKRVRILNGWVEGDVPAEYVRYGVPWACAGGNYVITKVELKPGEQFTAKEFFGKDSRPADHDRAICGCHSDTVQQCMFWDGEGGCVHPPRR